MISLANNIIQHLQIKNHKSFYLSLMRIFFGIFLLKEILFKLPQTAWLYSDNSIFKFNNHSSFEVIGIDVSFLKAHYQIVLFLYIIFVLFFIVGFGKKITAFIVFILLLLLQKLNNSTMNGGDKLARLMMFYFLFANAYEYLSYKKSNTTNKPNTPYSNLLSNLAAYSMMIQLCLAYFMAFFNKICNPYWFNGTANYYVFLTEAFQGTRFNSQLAHSNLFVYSTTIFTLVFEGCFAFLIWFKKMRIPLLIGGFLLHFGIYFFMMIYNLQTIFLLPYGLFFSNDEMLHFVKKYFKLNFIK